MTITIHRWAATNTASAPVVAQSDASYLLANVAFSVAPDCTQIIPSWNALTPPKTAVEIQLRVRYGTRWSKYYRIALWDSATKQSQRTSFEQQRDDDGYVCTDTLVINAGADAVEALVLGYSANDVVPQLVSLTLTCSGDHDARAFEPGTSSSCQVDTPCFSQFSYDDQDGWCSPTSLGMVLGYWYKRTGQPHLAPFAAPEGVSQRVAPGVYDPAYEGFGNWAFNTAFAASLGLESFVAQMDSIAEIEPWLAAGVPVVMSIAWREGQLTGAPIAHSNGHLIVATGISASGDVLVADPAAATSIAVRRQYDRAELEDCWLRPHGTVYLIYPPHWPVPALAGVDAETAV